MGSSSSIVSRNEERRYAGLSKVFITVRSAGTGQIFNVLDYIDAFRRCSNSRRRPAGVEPAGTNSLGAGVAPYLGRCCPCFGRFWRYNFVMHYIHTKTRTSSRVAAAGLVVLGIVFI